MKRNPPYLKSLYFHSKLSLSILEASVGFREKESETWNPRFRCDRMIADVNDRYERQYSDVMTLQMLVAQLPKINAQVPSPKEANHLSL